MKRFLDILKMVVLLLVVVFFYSFSKMRNSARHLSGVEIEFVGGGNPFITQEAVNKLLIQKDSSYSSVIKETLDLREMETKLNENPMIRNAEVFVTVDGRLGAKIEQRDPIGRIQSDRGENYYLDSDGLQMPLSAVYSARVPLVNGVSDLDYEWMTDLLLKIREDDFMQKMVIGVRKKANNEVELDLRSTALKALLGKPENIEKKFQNFKAFYKKTKKDSTLDKYTAVNLKFNNQVIAIKK